MSCSSGFGNCSCFQPQQDYWEFRATFTFGEDGEDWGAVPTISEVLNCRAIPAGAQTRTGLSEYYERDRQKDEQYLLLQAGIELTRAIANGRMVFKAVQIPEGVPSALPSDPQPQVDLNFVEHRFGYRVQYNKGEKGNITEADLFDGRYSREILPYDMGDFPADHRVIVMYSPFGTLQRMSGPSPAEVSDQWQQGENGAWVHRDYPWSQIMRDRGNVWTVPQLGQREFRRRITANRVMKVQGILWNAATVAGQNTATGVIFPQIGAEIKWVI